MGKRILVSMFICIFAVISLTIFAGGRPQGTDPSQPVQLTYWHELNSNLAQAVTNFGETEIAKALQEKTNIRVNHIHPAQGAVTEAFNLLLASGNLPDLIEFNWLNFTGGPEKAIGDGYILALNDLIRDHAPNIRAFLDANPDIDRMIRTDEGNYYVIPFIRGDERNMVFFGPMLRRDWLTSLNLQPPTNIAEWETVLRAFRDQKGATSGISFLNWHMDVGQMFAGAFDTTHSAFFVREGRIHYGPIEPGYRAYVETMARWYREGFLDPNFASMDGSTYDSNILNGRSGAFFGYVGGGMGRFLNVKQGEGDTSWDLIGVPYPRTANGQLSMISQMDRAYVPVHSVAISATTRNPIAAIRYLDFHFSPEGQKLLNYGIEGRSFTMQNGRPVLLDSMLNDPNTPAAVKLANFVRSTYGGPFVQEWGFVEQYVARFPQQREALNNFVQTRASDHILPPITPTPQESQEIARIMSDIQTYQSEMFLRFVMGVEPLTNFDAYLNQIERMGIQRAIEINQAALERYLQR